MVRAVLVEVLLMAESHSFKYNKWYDGKTTKQIGANKFLQSS
jgi:hypothetical protein